MSTKTLRKTMVCALMVLAVLVSVVFVLPIVNYAQEADELTENSLKHDLTGAKVTSDSKHSSTSVPAASAVIDGKLDTAWLSASVANDAGTTTRWVELELAEAIDINKLVLYPRIEKGAALYFPKNFNIKVSSDGEAWTTALEVTDYTTKGTTEGEEFVFSTQYGVKYLRVEATQNTANGGWYAFGLSEIEAYCVFNSNKLGISAVGVKSDSKHPSTSVPDANAIIDGKLDTAWLSESVSNDAGTTPRWFELELASSIAVNEVVLYPRIESGAAFYFPKNFNIKVSPNGYDWTTALEVTGYTTKGTTEGERFSFPTQYGVKYMRVEATQNTANRGWYAFGMAEIELYYNDGAELIEALSNRLTISSVTASSSHPMHPADHLIDGIALKRDNIWSNNDLASYDPKPDTDVVFTLDELSCISGMYLYPRGGTTDINFPHKFYVSVSADGNTWSLPIYEVESYELGSSSEVQYIRFESIAYNVKYVKLTLAAGNNTSGYVHLSEVEVLGSLMKKTNEFAENLEIGELGYGDSRISYETSGLFKTEIISTTPEGIIDNDGNVTYPKDGAVTVTVTLKVTNILNSSDNVTVERTVTVKPESLLLVEKAASEIDLIYAPDKNADKLTLPTIDGYAVTVATSDREDIIDLSGNITRPMQTTGVLITLRLTDNATGMSAETAPLSVPVYKPYAEPTMSEGDIAKIKENYEDNAYGVFVHYISSYSTPGSVYADGTRVLTVDEAAEAFDAEAFARSMNDVGAEYVVFTVWHGDMRTLFPSMTNRRWRDDRRAEDSRSAKSYSDRDVIADIITELDKYGIDLHLYTHPCDGHDLAEDDQSLTGWFDSTDDYAVWNQYINELYYELCERYGDGIKGLWFDGGFNHVPRGEAQLRLRDTCTSFNPAMILTANLAFVEGEIYETPKFDAADYYCWEVPEGYNFVTDRLFARHQSAIVIANAGWFTTKPNTETLQNVPSAEEMFKFLVAMSSVSKEGGFLASTGFYPVHEGEVLDDYFMPGIGDALRKLNASYLAPMKHTILNTNDSTAYPTTENITVSGLAWGVATESKDGKTVYLHVLKAPEGNTLSLPATADGTIFKSGAVILNYDGTETPVTIVKTESGYSITLPDGVEWNDVDTVIKAERMEFDFVPKSSITLDSELIYNVYVPAVDYLKSFTVNGEAFDNAPIVTLEDGHSYYRVSVPMAASEAAKNIVLKATVTMDGKDYTGTFTMSIPKYAKRVIESGTNDEEVTLVKDVLAYIRAAYVYNDSENKDEVVEVIDEILGGYNNEFEKVAGSTNTESGLKSVIIVLETKPSVRFVLPEGADPKDYTFRCGDEILEYTTGIYNDGGKDYVYVEVELYAYQLVGEISYTDGAYSGTYHINSYYDFVTTSDAHKDNADLITLVEKLYNYCKSAEKYRASVTGS